VFCHAKRGMALDPMWYAGEFRMLDVDDEGLSAPCRCCVP
jgi:hypothetical protein